MGLQANVEDKQKKLESTAEREQAKFAAAKQELQQRWQWAANSFAAIERQVNSLRAANANSRWQIRQVDDSSRDIPWFRRAESGEITALHVHLRTLLAAGMAASGGDLDKARAAWAQAQATCPDDPRVAYAWGLVLAYHKKTAEALQQLEAAASRCDPPFIPAVQALAWVHLRRNNLAAAAPLVRQLADAAESRDVRWPTEQTKERTAQWLGTVAGFLNGPGQRAMPADVAEQLVRDIEVRLTDRRREAFDQSRKLFVEQHGVLVARAARPPDELAREIADEWQKLLDQLTEWEREQASLDAVLNDAPKHKTDAAAAEIGDLRMVREKKLELERAARKAALALRGLLSAGPAKSGTEYEKETNKSEEEENNGRRRKVKVSTDRDISTFKARVAAAQSALAAAETALQEVDASAQKIKDRRDAIAKEFDPKRRDQQETADELRQRIQALKVRIQTLHENSTTPESLQAQIQSLATYLPFDFEVETKRLQASLTTPLPRWAR